MVFHRSCLLAVALVSLMIGASALEAQGSAASAQPAASPSIAPVPGREKLILDKLRLAIGLGCRELSRNPSTLTELNQICDLSLWRLSGMVPTQGTTPAPVVTQ